jgi:hypothetical protein
MRLPQWLRRRNGSGNRGSLPLTEVGCGQRWIALASAREFEVPNTRQSYVGHGARYEWSKFDIEFVAEGILVGCCPDGEHAQYFGFDVPRRVRVGEGVRLPCGW